VHDFFVLPRGHDRQYFINSKGRAADKRIEQFRCKTLGEVFRHLEVARKSGTFRITTMLRKRRSGTALYPRVNSVRAGRLTRFDIKSS
jgi:hypothetical protein